MDDTTPKVDPVAPVAPSNDVSPSATPVVNAVDPAEFERLKKEQEKKDMRIRQLENEAAKRLADDETAKTAELEKNQEYKSMMEQERAKREDLESKIAADERQKELTQLSDTTLGEYPDEVKSLAAELDLSLSDVTDEAVQDFRAKLDAAAKRVGGSAVGPNNGNPAPTDEGRPTGEQLREILADPIRRDEYYRKYKPVTAAMMAPPQP